jgi:hypothetical protein
MEPPEFDEESMYGYAARHKLALKDTTVLELIYALSEGNADAVGHASHETMDNFFRVLCSLLRKEAWLQAEAAATFAGICVWTPPCSPDSSTRTGS